MQLNNSDEIRENWIKCKVENSSVKNWIRKRKMSLNELKLKDIHNNKS